MNRWRQIIKIPRFGSSMTQPAASGPRTTSCSVWLPSGFSTSSMRSVIHQLEYTSRSVEWVIHSPSRRAGVSAALGGITAQ